jgi:hypothetical protein
MCDGTQRKVRVLMRIAKYAAAFANDVELANHRKWSSHRK